MQWSDAIFYGQTERSCAVDHPRAGRGNRGRVCGAPAEDAERGWELKEFDALADQRARRRRPARQRDPRHRTGHRPGDTLPVRHSATLILEEYAQVRDDGHPQDGCDARPGIGTIMTVTDWRAALDDDLRLPDGLSPADAVAELTEAPRSPDPVLRDELGLTVLLNLMPRLDPGLRHTLGASMAARFQDPEIQAGRSPR